MKIFHCYQKTQINDEYMTPKYAWESIKNFIPKDKVIWEPFYGDGKSGEYLRELGFNVIHENIDFFDNNLGDVVVSNPPFSLSTKIVKRLIELDKPFILLLPLSRISSCFKKLNYQIIIPSKRIQYDKLENGVRQDSLKRCFFDTVFFCYKMNFEKDIIYL